MGYDVSIPLTESAAYDLIVDDGCELARVQCKFVNNHRRQVDLRRIHSNSKGYVVKRSTEDSYDWLFVFDGVGTEYLIKTCFANRRSVSLREVDKLRAPPESGRLDPPWTDRPIHVRPGASNRSGLRETPHMNSARLEAEPGDTAV